MRSLASIVFLLLILPRALGAQTLTGRVVDRDGGAPLDGAVVMLQDSAGRQVRAVLSREDGRFILDVPRAGRYRLVAERIGYAATADDWLDLARRDSVDRSIALAVEPISLESIEVQQGRQCTGDPRAAATARVWSEARKALVANQLTQGEAVLRYGVLGFRRTLDPGTHQVLEQRLAPIARVVHGSPYLSLDPDSLAAAGYVQLAPGQQLDYYAPDATVLLSSSFLDTHCFRLQRAPPGEPGLIGLAFQPREDRALPDIDGVFWLDRRTAELRRLDFRYVGLRLPSTIADDDVGGRVEFRRLPTGDWIVSRWRLRAPVGYRRPRRAGRPTRLIALNETGAQVTRVEYRGRPIWRPGLPALAGIVHDDAGHPIRGATVAIMGDTGSIASAPVEPGPGGRFRFDGLPPGTYAVRVSHPALPMFYVEQLVRFDPAPDTLPTVQVHGIAGEVARVCRMLGWRDSIPPALLYGTVAEPDGRPASRATVVVRQRKGEEGRPEARRTAHDAQHVAWETQRVPVSRAGRYRACIAPGLAADVAATPGKQDPAALPDSAWTPVLQRHGLILRADLVVADTSRRVLRGGYFRGGYFEEDTPRRIRRGGYGETVNRGGYGEDGKARTEPG
ncbi:MAG: carboxypeptidase-like regulatory domain-containing protein, partial [Gemmatimonadota bacterium]